MPAVICSILVLVTLCGIKIINNILKNENSNSFGATGNLGAYVALHLKAVGYDVIAVGHRKNDNGFSLQRYEILFGGYNESGRV